MFSHLCSAHSLSHPRMATGVHMITCAPTYCLLVLNSAHTMHRFPQNCAKPVRLLGAVLDRPSPSSSCVPVLNSHTRPTQQQACKHRTNPRVQENSLCLLHVACVHCHECRHVQPRCNTPTPHRRLGHPCTSHSTPIATMTHDHTHPLAANLRLGPHPPDHCCSNLRSLCTSRLVHHALPHATPESPRVPPAAASVCVLPISAVHTLPAVRPALPTVPLSRS